MRSLQAPHCFATSLQGKTMMRTVSACQHARKQGHQNAHAVKVWFLGLVLHYRNVSQRHSRGFEQGQ